MQIQVPSAKRFAEERGESIPTSIWSDFESTVLSVIKDSVMNGEESAIVKLYNDTVYYSTALFCHSPLPHDIVFREKNHLQIQAKLHFMARRLL